MALVKWAAPVSATAVAGASMNALADAAYAMGAAIDNTVTSNGYLYGDLDLVLSGSVTAGANAPHVAVFLLPTLDGTNYPTPPGGTAGATPGTYLVGTMHAQPSAGFTVGIIRGIVLPPFSFRIAIQNSLGVAFPSGTGSLCRLYRYYEQAV